MIAESLNKVFFWLNTQFVLLCCYKIVCKISASFQDIDILNHGIQKRLSRVEASTSERRKRSYDVEEEVDESVTSGKSPALGKPDPKFLPTNLETLSSAEVQAIFNQSVVYNESKIDGLFTRLGWPPNFFPHTI